MLIPCNPIEADSELSSDEKAPDYTHSSSTTRHILDNGSTRAYRKLKSAYFLNAMYRGHNRIKVLLKKHDLDSTFARQLLPVLDASVEDLLTSVKRSRVSDAAEKLRLVDLAKQILKDWEYTENLVGRLNPAYVSRFDIDRSDSQLAAVPSAWLLESDWRDMAYEEVMSIRDEHSCLIDHAYIYSYKEYYETNEMGSMSLRRKKYLNLLGSSREDIGFLSKKKCYKRVMGIKDILARREERDLDPLSLDATGQTELPNWRDEIYDEIRSLRKMYSLELDDVLRRVTGLSTERRGQGLEECLNFLEESLNFLSTCRSDLVHVTKDYCRERLDGIKSFVEDVDGSVQAKQLAKLLESAGQPHCKIIFRASNGSINWRDLAYEQLQYKRDRFVYYVYGVYLANRITWSKIPEFRENLEFLEKRLISALGFYKMPRARMSTLETMDDYFKLVDRVVLDCMACMRVMRQLLGSLGKKSTYWRLGFLIPKRRGLPHAHIKMSSDFVPTESDSDLSSNEDFLNAMYNCRKRIKLLLTKDLHSTLPGHLLPSLDARFEDFLTSVKRTKDSDAAEMLRLVDLAKQILKGWEYTENLVGRLNPSLVSQFNIDRSDDQLAAPPSAWLLESDWRDMAYEEVMSIRNKHSCLMDQAYIDSYKKYIEAYEMGSMALRRKKCLNLLGCSREDIDYLSKKKCYKRVMGIKDILARREVVDLERLSRGATCQTDLPNWRDETYDEIRSLRKLYSLGLDDMLRQVTGLSTEGQGFGECLCFLLDSLSFLSASRTDLVFVTKDYCRERLDCIKSFVEDADGSVQAKQLAKLLESAGQPHRQIISRASNGSINWRDLAYEQLQYKSDRFVYYVYGVYMENIIAWSKIPEFCENLKILEKHLVRALGFYKMPRGRMSTLETVDDYFQLVNQVTADYMHAMDLMKHLLESLGKKVTPWRHVFLVPKRKRLPLAQQVKMPCS